MLAARLCRRLGPLATWLLLFVVGPAAVAGPAAEPQIAAAPAWVRATEPVRAENPPDSEIKGGVQYLLYEQQVRVTQTLQSTFRHVALRAANDSGLSSLSHVELSFNPAFQKLTLHQVVVRRGSQVMDKLKRSAIQVLQRERELEYRVLDGTRSANLFLDDVRVGDVVEYAYTLEGSNPVFGGARFGRFDLQWSVPVERLRYRLLWPGGRPLHLLARNGAGKASVSAANGFEEHLWERERVAGLTVEADAPGWYDPYPAVAWGDFDSWKAVVDWALPLYRVPPSLGAELSRVQREIAHDHAAPEDRVTAVLRLVQSQVRYLGVEVGVNSHAPHAPELVYSRRFGDCKDKALLMVSLLKGLGIDASTALVNTGLRQGIAEALPSPSQFDHVIVHLRLGGRSFWLDPTRPTQAGRLDKVYQPDYGQALVVSRDTQALVPMASPEPRLNKREIALALDASAGPGKAAGMVVRSVYRGLAADGVRSDIASRSSAELQKSYLNFYAGLYPGASVSAAMEVQDDSEENRLTVTEHYSVPEIWRKAEGKAQMQLVVYSAEVKEYLKQTAQPVRASPLQVPYPFEISVQTDVRLPANWQPQPSSMKINADAFEYSSEVRWPAHNQVVLTDTYRTLADQVPAAGVRAHIEKIDETVNALGYHLSYPVSPSVEARGFDAANVNWTVVLIGLLFAAGLVRAALAVYRFDPPAPPTEVRPQLRGIDGWLLWAALTALLIPLRALKLLWDALPVYSQAGWAGVTAAGAAGHSGWWAPVLLLELLVYLALIVFGLLLAVLFFRKRSSLPRIWIAFFVGSLCLATLDQCLSSLLPAQPGQPDATADVAALVKQAIATLAWAAYFLRSRRVRDTFVERLARATAPADVAAEGSADGTASPA